MQTAFSRNRREAARKNPPAFTSRPARTHIKSAGPLCVHLRTAQNAGDIFPYSSSFSLRSRSPYGCAISFTSNRRIPPLTLSSASSLVEIIFPTVVWNFFAMFHKVSSGWTM